MKPLPEMQFIKSISQYKCQFSIEQALPPSSFSSLSLWSKYPRSGGEAWLCAPDGILQSDPAGWGRGLLLLSHPTWPRATLPKSREGTASKVKPPHPADILSSFVEIGPSHLTYLHLKPFSGPLPDNHKSSQPRSPQLHRASLGLFSTRWWCFTQEIWVRCRWLPATFALPAPRWCLPHHRTWGVVSICKPPSQPKPKPTGFSKSPL